MDQPLQFTSHQLYGYESSRDLREMGIKGPGIYVLRFTDDTRYVGKSDDLASRISTHLREQHRRIERVDVAAVSYTETDIHEVLTIFERQAAGEQLTNELHNKAVPLRPDGRPVRDAQTVEGIRWALLAAEDEVAQRASRLRVPTGASALPVAAGVLASPVGAATVRVLAAYIGHVLRCPADTEWTYWRVSTPTRRLKGGGRILARLTVRHHKLLEVLQTREGHIDVATFLHLTTELDPDYDAISVMLDKYSRAAKHTALDHEDFHRALSQDPLFRAGARVLAHELMRQGPCTTTDIPHDWALADAVFSSLPATIQETR
ncbi:GIY-YIG nuclease family protein [Kocuria oceani]|uniref:GIY-YIG nuclease family protein n=1 Tax=Kocuria oceani TaxID=988827 RepID=UPI004035FC49